jgi:hypothetical protein
MVLLSVAASEEPGRCALTWSTQVYPSVQVNGHFLFSAARFEPPAYTRMSEFTQLWSRC